MRLLAGRFIGNSESELDRILSREDEILPSSGFEVSVMDAVRRQAATPPPIPFPWKRALPGLVVLGLALTLVLIAMVVAIAHAAKATAPEFSVSLPSGAPPWFHGAMESAVAWTVVALLTAFFSVKLSMRLGAGRI